MTEYIAKCNEVVGISGKTLIVPDYIDTSKEIVRCRDCEYQGNLRKCWLVETKPDEFCSRGKRKEGGDGLDAS